MMLVATAITACGASSPPTSVAAKHYDRTCLSVADCVAVYEGPVGCCDGPGCPNTAISQVAHSKYTIDYSRATNCACPGGAAGHNGGIGGCPDGRVACDNGICMLATLPGDAATDE